MKEARVLAGYVDFWDGRSVGGWAVDRNRPASPCEVDIYVDGRFVVRRLADLERPDLIEVAPNDQRRGFRVELAPEVRPRAHLEVCFGGTTQRIPQIETVRSHLWRPRIDPVDSVSGAASRWVPMPPAALITHVTGEVGEEGVLQAAYRRVGFALAADIYNMSLELGADPHRAGYSIVDLGCGCGRVATYFSQWIEDANFLGVDIWRTGIDWATEKITGVYGSYRFHCSVAGEKGYSSGEHHGIPAEDGKTDYVISTSLFTHLDVGACDGYLREIGRILAPGGLAYVTFFLRDEQSMPTAERMAQAVALPLIKERDAWFYRRGGYIDIFHDPERVISVAGDAGLRPVLRREGRWRGPARSSVNPVAFQDLLVFRKD